MPTYMRYLIATLFLGLSLHAGAQERTPTVGTDEQLPGSWDMFQTDQDRFDAKVKSLNLEPYQSENLYALFPNPEKITPLEKRGINTALIVRDKGEDHFVKLWFSEEAQKLGGDDAFLVQFASLHEAAASRIASLLTDGLVPAGKTGGGLAIVYPMVQVDSKATSAMFESRYPKHVKETLYSKLTEKQKAQVFVHAMTDLLLDNRDTHADQFAVDTSGNFVGFDKGRAFLEEVFENKPAPTSFDLKASSIDKSDIYASFMAHLRNNTKDLKNILSSETVTKFFDALDTLSDEDLMATMSPLFRYVDYRIKKEGIKSFTLFDLQQKFANRFRSLRSFLSKWLDVPSTAFRSYYETVDARIALNMKEDSDGLRYITADLSKYDVKVISTNDFTQNGANVLETVKKTRALAGINGGYFQNTDISALQNTYFGKAFFYGLNIIRSHTGYGAELFKVFPSQILKTERDLIGDSGELYPCFGWNLKTRDFIAGEVKTQWLLYPPKAEATSTPLTLERVSHYHYKNKLQFLYTGALKIEISDGSITEISPFDRAVRFGSVPEYNSYKFSEKADADAAAGWLGALKVGDSLEIGYQLQGETADETARWAKVDQVVNGQGVLVKNGVAQDVLAKNQGIGIPSSGEKTAICATGDGKMMQFVAKDISFHNLAKRLVEVGCTYGLSLDGGASTVMAVKVPTGFETYISDRAIADVIVVLPKSRDHTFTPSDVAGTDVFPLIKAGNVEQVKAALKKNPDLLFKKDSEGRSLLHVAIDEGAKSDFVVANFLIDFIESNPAYDSLLKEKNFFNETPLVSTSLRYDLAHPSTVLAQVISKLAMRENFSELDFSVQVLLAHIAAMTKNERMADRVFELAQNQLSKVLAGTGEVVGELIKVSKKGASWALENEKNLRRQYPKEAGQFTREELAEIDAAGSLFALAMAKGKIELAQSLVGSIKQSGFKTALVVALHNGHGDLAEKIAEKFADFYEDNELNEVIPRFANLEASVVKQVVGKFNRSRLTEVLYKDPSLLANFAVGAFGAFMGGVNLYKEEGYPAKTLAQRLLEDIIKDPNGLDWAKFEVLERALGSSSAEIIGKAIMAEIPSVLTLDPASFENLITRADLMAVQDQIYFRSLARLLLLAIVQDPNGVDTKKIDVVLDAPILVLKNLAVEGDKHNEPSFLTILLMEHFDLGEKLLARFDETTKAEIINSLSSRYNPKHNLIYLLCNQDSWKDGKNHTKSLSLILPYMKPETIERAVYPYFPFGYLMLNEFATADAIGLMAKYTSGDDLWRALNFKHYLASQFLFEMNGKEGKGGNDYEKLIAKFEQDIQKVESNLEKLKRVSTEISPAPSKEVVESFESEKYMFGYYLEEFDARIAFLVEEILKRYNIEYREYDLRETVPVP